MAAGGMVAVRYVVEEWAGDELGAIPYQVGAYTPWLSGSQAEE